MRFPSLALLLLGLGCQSGAVKIGQTRPDIDDTGDTGVSTDSDTAAGDDTGSDSAAGDDTGDSTGDSGDSADTVDSGPQPDYSEWEGARQFVIDSDWWSCDDSTREYAAPVSDSDMETAMAEACPECDALYEVSVSPDTVCDYIGLSDPAWRGVVFGDGFAAVYTFSEDWGGDISAELLDSGASFDGWTISYAYEIDYYGQTVSITGTMEFPELEQ